MRFDRQRLIQSVGEALIPLLGFYFWNWDVHSIFLFYYLDMLTYCLFSTLKFNKIARFQGNFERTNTLFYFNKLLSLFILAALIMEVSITYLYPKINLWESLLDFATEREWGIPQIILLIPLLLFANYQEYKLFFLSIGVYRDISVQQFNKNSLFTALCTLLGSVFFLLLIFADFSLIPFSVWFVVLIKFAFDAALYPYWEKKQKIVP